MHEKQLIMAAKALCVVFTPFYLPIVGLAILLVFTYLSLLPFTYKLFLLFTVWLFTVFIPTVLIRRYRRYQGWTGMSMGKERRAVPYVISIVSYLVCCYIMETAHVPYFICSVVIAALVVQVACAVCNVFMKISTHTAAIGGVAGALVAFSVVFSFNPVWWLCAVLMLAGIVGSSRMVLRSHSLSQVVLGFLVGAAGAFASVMLV